MGRAVRTRDDELRRTGACRALRAPALAALLALAATPSFAHNPVGKWQVSTGESRYQVTRCQRDRLCAKLIWLREDARDAKALQYLDKYVVAGAIEILPNEWSGALNYGGDVYEGRLSIQDDAHMSLKGCKGMFCQTFRLIRYNPTGR